MAFKIFEEIFGELFKPREGDRFLGVVKRECLKTLESRIEFKEGDDLGSRRRSRRPYIAVRYYGSRYRVVFLTSLFGADREVVELKRICFSDRRIPECRGLQEVCFTYRYAYIVSELTLKRFSSICGRCVDLEHIDRIPVGGEEKGDRHKACN